MATSVGGTLTGRGGDYLIIDDPLKPADAFSETLRRAANDWCDNTAFSRLNNKQDGVMIVVMQRLHQDDLVGHLLELGDWDVLRFPAIAEEDERYTAETEFGPIQFERSAGEVLDAERETLETLLGLQKNMGEYAFQSQYQQNPMPVGGVITARKSVRRASPTPFRAGIRRVKAQKAMTSASAQPGVFSTRTTTCSTSSASG
jgi:hypothetical protein